MIVEVDESNITMAAKIHSRSWQESHKDFCKAEFVELHTTKHQEEYLRQEVNTGKKLYMLIESKPVGIVSVYNSMIENLYVLPEEQHKGYGTKLLKFAMQHCEGIPTLWILDNNKKAYSLYSKYGFLITGKKNRLSESISEIEMKCGKGSIDRDRL